MTSYNAVHQPFVPKSYTHKECLKIWKQSKNSIHDTSNMQKTEVPRDDRNSKVRKQDKFGRDWSEH